MKRAAKRDIENLDAATDGEKGQMFPERFGEDGKFPSIAGFIGIFDQRGIGHGLSQEFFGDIGTAGEKKTVDVFRDQFDARIVKAHVGIAGKGPRKVGLINFPNPSGDLFQLGTLLRQGA